jgi:putative oxidoreductase
VCGNEGHCSQHLYVHCDGMKLSFPSYEAGPITLLLAVLFIYAGGVKLMSMPSMVEEFAQIGIGQWFRYFTGILEVSGAIGILLPSIRFWAALLIAIVMAGATVANLTILPLPGMAGFTVVLMAVAITFAWQWRPAARPT